MSITMRGGFSGYKYSSLIAAIPPSNTSVCLHTNYTITGNHSQISTTFYALLTCDLGQVIVHHFNPHKMTSQIALPQGGCTLEYRALTAVPLLHPATITINSIDIEPTCTSEYIGKLSLLRSLKDTNGYEGSLSLMKGH